MPDSVTLLIAATIIVGFLLAVDYLSWRSRTNYRRRERLVHRNLQRMAGR